MSDWLTYELTDFLMFSPGTYWRMIELYNQEVWPFHIVYQVLFLAGVMLSVYRKQRWLVSAVLSLSWFAIGFFFFLYRYGEIFWAASTWSWAFGLQGVLFLLVALTDYQKREEMDGICPRSAAVLALLVIGIPLIQFAFDVEYGAYQIVGIVPDPTALIAVLALIAVRAPWWSFPTPILWLTFSTLTLYAMEERYYWVWLASTVGFGALALGFKRFGVRNNQPHWAR